MYNNLTAQRACSDSDELTNPKSDTSLKVLYSSFTENDLIILQNLARDNY